MRYKVNLTCFFVLTNRIFLLYHDKTFSGQSSWRTLMMRSQVKMPIMLFVLSLMAAFCSAKDNKPPDTKVTAFILMATTHIFYSS